MLNKIIKFIDNFISKHKKIFNKIFVCVLVIILCIIVLLSFKVINKFEVSRNVFERIDGVLYLNLYYRKDRYESVNQILTKLQVPKNKIHRINAYYVPLNGHKGCTKAHIDALEYAKKNNLKNVLIFEDDIKLGDNEVDKFHNNFNKMIDLLEKNNVKWDVIMLGTTSAEKKDTNIDPTIKQVTYALGSWAYLINGHYYDTLNNVYKNSFETLHIDSTDNVITDALDRKWDNLIKNDNWYTFSDDNTIINHNFEIESTSINTEMKSNNNKYNDVLIPKKIHQIWIGSDANNLPEHKKLYMSSYKKILPTWEYQLWTDNDLNINNFPLTYQYIEKLLNMNDKGKYAKIADLIRYEILFKEGGFYFDTNIELLKDITDLFYKKDGQDFNYDFIVCCEDDNGLKNKTYLSNGFFGCKKNSKFISRILNDVVLREIDFNNDANRVTGPSLFVKCLTEEDYSNPKINYLEPKIIFPVHWSQNKNDKCVLDTHMPNNQQYETIFNDKKYGLIYPCDQYGESYAIDHFIFGGSWTSKN